MCGQLEGESEDLHFGYSIYGKSYALVDTSLAPISFNVRHSGRHGLIAFAPEGRLGVDIEERAPRRNLEGLIESAFGPGEQSDMKLAHGHQKIDLFFRLRTIKEALIKAVGPALARDMAQCEAPYPICATERGA